MQKSVQASDQELKAINPINKRWSEKQDQRPAAGNKGSKYTSNKTHYTPIDPDARISVKPGKAKKLNYLSQTALDTGHHVITDIRVCHADGKDNQQLQDISLRLKTRLWNQGLQWTTLLTDTGYSSGENYALLEAHQLISYTPPHGTYKGGPEGFIYDEKEDKFICPERKDIPFVKYFLGSSTKTKKEEYRAGKSACKGCQIRTYCFKKSQEKRIILTSFRKEYKRNNARGLDQANKIMHLFAMTYNLKKYLKFTQKLAKSRQGTRLSIKQMINGLYHITKWILDIFKNQTQFSC